MKKIGIMSMQRVYNYGSFLQAYGLKKIIEELGCEVEFVDYQLETCLVKNDVLTRKTKVITKFFEYMKIRAPFKQKIKFILYKKNYAKKYYSFLGINSKKNYQPELDALVIGSDEVFNCVQSNVDVGYSKELFGKNNKANRLISYAASFGNTTYNKISSYGISGELAELLSKFDSLSVRDDNSSSIIEYLCEVTPECHLDPVLAYDFSHDCKEIPEGVPLKNYIILYGYSGRLSKEECNRIREYASVVHKKIVCIGGVQQCCDIFIDCNPFEVLAYFKCADAIITDTFHGTIFSIINHKQFLTLRRKSIGDSYGNEEKLSDLLNRLQLESRLVYDLNDMSSMLNVQINYEATDKIICIEQKLKNIWHPSFYDFTI